MTADSLLTSFVRISFNKKTGPIPVTMSESSTCPDSCPWKGTNGCYAEYSRTGMQFRALSTDGISEAGRKVISPIPWEQLCRHISVLPRGQVWRKNIAGDLPGIGDTLDHQMLDQLVRANTKAGAKGFCYTHKPVGFTGQLLINACAIRAANTQGFTISLSADGLKQADRLSDLNIAPVVAVVDKDAGKRFTTPAGRGCVVCPAEYTNLTCDRCRLCIKKNRTSIVCFRAHGPGRVKVSNKLKVLQ